MQVELYNCHTGSVASNCFCLSLGGAMRLPSEPDATEKIHFLTDFYNKKFQMDLVPFNNSDEDGFLKFYNEERITHSGRTVATVV